MASNISLDSVDYDVFFVEQVSNEPSRQGNNSAKILNSTELSGTQATEMPTFSSVASPEPDIVTLDDDSNESTRPYGFGGQLPIIPPRLNDPNLPPKQLNILALMAVVHPTGDGEDKNYSPSHRGHLVHRPFQHHPRTSVHLSVGKRRKPQLTTTPFIQRTSHGAYSALLPWMKLFIQKANPDEYLCCPVHHRRHLLAS